MNWIFTISLISLAGSVASLIFCVRAFKNINRIWHEIKGVPVKEGTGDCPATFYLCEMCQKGNVEWITGECPDCGHYNSETPVSMAQRYHYSTKDPRDEEHS